MCHPEKIESGAEQIVYDGEVLQDLLLKAMRVVDKTVIVLDLLTVDYDVVVSEELVPIHNDNILVYSRRIRKTVTH